MISAHLASCPTYQNAAIADVGKKEGIRITVKANELNQSN